MFDVVALGDRLARARERRGIPQRELAERVGVSAGYMSRVERGQVEGVPLKLIHACASELGESIEWLVRGGTSDEQFIYAFRAMPERQQRRIKAFAEHVGTIE